LPPPPPPPFQLPKAFPLPPPEGGPELLPPPLPLPPPLLLPGGPLAANAPMLKLDEVGFEEFGLPPKPELPLFPPPPPDHDDGPAPPDEDDGPPVCEKGLPAEFEGGGLPNAPPPPPPPPNGFVLLSDDGGPWLPV
jgi:hypothetical protein